MNQQYHQARYPNGFVETKQEPQIFNMLSSPPYRTAQGHCSNPSGENRSTIPFTQDPPTESYPKALPENIFPYPSYHLQQEYYPNIWIEPNRNTPDFTSYYGDPSLPNSTFPYENSNYFPKRPINQNFSSMSFYPSIQPSQNGQLYPHFAHVHPNSLPPNHYIEDGQYPIPRFQNQLIQDNQNLHSYPQFIEIPHTSKPPFHFIQDEQYTIPRFQNRFVQENQIAQPCPLFIQHKQTPIPSPFVQDDQYSIHKFLNHHSQDDQKSKPSEQLIQVLQNSKSSDSGVEIPQKNYNPSKTPVIAHQNNLDTSESPGQINQKINTKPPEENIHVARIQENKNSNPLPQDQTMEVNQNGNPQIQKIKNKEFTPVQLALKDLQDIAKRFGYSISGKKIKKVMADVFLSRFPNGTDMCDGKMSSMYNVKNMSAVSLNRVIQEWIVLDGMEGMKQYFDQVVRRSSIRFDVKGYQNNSEGSELSVQNSIQARDPSILVNQNQNEQSIQGNENLNQIPERKLNHAKQNIISFSDGNSVQTQNHIVRGQSIQEKINQAKGTPEANFDLKFIARRIWHDIPDKEIKKLMAEAFLLRFPTGTDMCGGDLSSMYSIKHASNPLLANAIQQWIIQSGSSEELKQCFYLVAISKGFIPPQNDLVFQNDH
jgi:hypothetical protein